MLRYKVLPTPSYLADLMHHAQDAAQIPGHQPGRSPQKADRVRNTTIWEDGNYPNFAFQYRENDWVPCRGGDGSEKE